MSRFFFRYRKRIFVLNLLRDVSFVMRLNAIPSATLKRRLFHIMKHTYKRKMKMYVHTNKHTCLDIENRETRRGLIAREGRISSEERRIFRENSQYTGMQREERQRERTGEIRMPIVHLFWTQRRW